MPKIGTSFSESSFAFAFTENLINGGHLAGSAPPQFLSTYAEGRGDHWDIHLPACPVAFFFQFKIPHVLQRGGALANLTRLRRPFYRMNLRSENGYAQHHGLLRLQADGGNIYYVCPRFHEGPDFHTLFARKEVPQHSVWFRPSQITPPDYMGRHGVVYDTVGQDWEVRSSDPRPGDGSIDYQSFGSAWARAVDAARPQRPAEFMGRVIRSLEVAIEAAAEGQVKVEQAAIDAPDTLKLDRAHEFEIPSEPPRLLGLPTPSMDLLAQAVSRARSMLGLEVLVGGKS